MYPVARKKRHIAYCDVNMHKHEPNVSTQRHILQVTRIRVNQSSTMVIAFEKHVKVT